MDSRKIFGVVLIVVGAIMLFFADYIADRVAEGRMQIEQGQRTVDTANSVFSSNKYTKPFGSAITGSSQREIDAGRMQVSQYTTLANGCRILGIVFIALGVGIVFFWRKRS